MWLDYLRSGALPAECRGSAYRAPTGHSSTVMFHGEPSWSYLYRKMIPVLASARIPRQEGPDLVGFWKVRQADAPRELHVPAPRELDD